jgi:hypothetical protein
MIRTRRRVRYDSPTLATGEAARQDASSSGRRTAGRRGRSFSSRTTAANASAAATIQITLRKRRPLAAYLQIRAVRGKVTRTKKITSSLLVDYDQSGKRDGP